MLATLLIFAQEAAEHEPSKTAFYVLAALAAAWAVVAVRDRHALADVPRLAGRRSAS